MDRGTWWTTVHGATKNWTQLNNEHFHFIWGRGKLSVCPKSLAWDTRQVDGECMFFLRTILPSHCPGEIPRVKQVDMGVTSPSCIEKCSTLPLRFHFTMRLLYSGTASLHMQHWLGTPQRRRVGEKNVHLAKLVRRAQGIPFSLIFCVLITVWTNMESVYCDVSS